MINKLGTGTDRRRSVVEETDKRWHHTAAHEAFRAHGRAVSQKPYDSNHFFKKKDRTGVPH